MPQRKVFGIELTDDQYDQYVIEAGKDAKKKLDSIVNSLLYDKMPDMAKEKVIRSIVSTMRKKAAINQLQAMGIEKVREEFEENVTKQPQERK